VDALTGGVEERQRLVVKLDDGWRSRVAAAVVTG
jgi:hypothetical protein